MTSTAAPPVPSLVLDKPPDVDGSAVARPAVEVEGLRKAYGDHTVLRDLSMSVAPGEIFGLLGSNGAGKTTTVEIIQGLRPRDGGTIRLLGFDPAKHRGKLRQLVGAQLQASALPDRLKVGEALRLFAKLADNVVDWRQLRDEWNLGKLEKRSFGALSGGERQRLFVALALVNKPRLVFLDELTQGLDAAARRDTWRIIEQVRDQGATVVLVTHFMDEAERLCDRVAVLHDGRIVATGRPSQLVASVGAPVLVRFSATHPADAVAGLDRVAGVRAVAHQRGQVEITCDAAVTVPVVAEIARRGLTPDDLTIVRPSLEDAFVILTTGEVR